jgi:hypothetical protein
MTRKDEPLAKRVRAFAISLFILPFVMFPILIYPLFYEPSLLLEGWDIYVLFFGIPWALSVATWKYSKILERGGH